jgi:hypothetical protein
MKPKGMEASEAQGLGAENKERPIGTDISIALLGHF